jgi:histone family protein DNA-binding protein
MELLMTAPMNRPEVIDTIASATGEKKAAVERVLSALESTVTDSLNEGREVKISGFMAFSTVTLSARTTKNPRTGDDISVPERQAVRIRPLSRFKNSLIQNNEE